MAKLRTSSLLLVLAAVPGLAEHDVEGELQNESKLDTFRERFGNAEAISAVILDERDALAYTGSGKTLAFLIPLFTVLEQSMRGMDKKKRRLAGVQAVVIAPTRELAMQLTK
ncbi:hypothetical protein T484DRAFT_1792840, partial [Baffinella frigidus]